MLIIILGRHIRNIQVIDTNMITETKESAKVNRSIFNYAMKMLQTRFNLVDKIEQ